MPKKKGGGGAWSWGEFRQQGTGMSPWVQQYNWGAGRSSFSWEEDAPITDGTQVVAHHSYDRVLADRVVSSGKVGASIAPYKGDLPTATALGRDVFWSLYKRNVELQDVPMRDGYELNKELIEEMRATDEYLDLHATTMGDSWMAETAGEKLAGPILSHLSSETKERVSRQTQLADALRALEARAAALEELQAEQPSELLARGLDENRVSQEELRKQIEELRGSLSDEELQAIRQHLRGQMANVASQMQSIQSGFNALGGSMGGGGLAYAQGATAAFGRYADANARKAQIAAKLLSDKKLRMIAELAGRMADIAWQVQNSKTPDPTDELTDIRTGRDFAHMLSGEMIYMDDPDLEDIFLYKAANNLIQSYQIIGYSPQGKGPIVVMIDNSGSMSGTPEEWSKAVMLALRMIAEKQKRDFYVIHFDSAVQKEYEFLKGVASPGKMLEAVEFFSGGGTNFEPPMRAAMKKMRESRYKRADAIFVTDGLCGIRDEECAEWNRIRQQAGMHSYCILIGDDRWGRGVMEKLTDKMMVIDPEKLMAEHTSTDSDVLQTVFSV